MESCPSCGNDSPVNSLHCVHCGAKLVSTAQKTQFGMPVIRPGSLPSAQTGTEGPQRADAQGADAQGAAETSTEAQSTEEFEPQDLARLAMATRKKPGSALSGLGGLQSGRRPGSLLQGLPKFRGVGQSPLTSGEFKLGALGGGGLGGLGKGTGGLGASSLGKGTLGKGTAGDPLSPAPGASEQDAALGLYSAAKRSSLPPEAAPESSVPPTQATPAVATDAADAPTMAMQGVNAHDLEATASEDDNTPPADAATPDAATPDAATGDAGAGEVAPTMVLQGVSDAAAAGAAVVAVAGDPMATAEEQPVAHIPHDATASKTASVADSSVAAAAAAASAATPTEPPLPTAMRGSERAHHPGPKGVTQARVEESSGNGKWIVIGVLVLAAIGAAVWFATR